MKNFIAHAVAMILFLPFWVLIGPCMAPVWLVITILGALLGSFEWKETPRIFKELVFVEWFWND